MWYSTALLVTALWTLGCTGEKDHLQMHSFYPPILADFWESGLNYWSFGQGTVVTDEYVRLTTSTDAMSRGYFWNRHPNHLESFRVNVTLRLTKRSHPWFSDTTQAGVAVWYVTTTPRHQPAPFYGGIAAFEGLGIVLDHSDHISILINDGEQLSVVDAHRRGHCYISGASEHYVTLYLTYGKDSNMLRAFYEVSQHHVQIGRGNLVHCADVSQVRLPPRGYFGITAANAPTAQAQHEVRSFLVKPMKGNDDAEETEEEEVGLHLFDLKKEKELQQEWSENGDKPLDPAKNGEQKPSPDSRKRNGDDNE
jgi:hypothetical protein